MDIDNDDQWLYGDGEPDGDVDPKSKDEADEAPAEKSPEPAEEPPEPAEAAPPEPTVPIEPSPINYPDDQFDDDGPPGVDAPDENDNEEIENEREDGELKQNGDEEEDLDDDSDDGVNVVIGDIQTSPSYPAQQQQQQQQHSIKRGGLSTAIVDKSKQIQQPGKFQIEEFEQIGTINGMASCEYNLDSLEDKPWRKPGSDITDYFNYGFNEDTWKAYCERQKRIRINESGVGIMPLNSIGLPRGSMDNKYGNQNFIQPISRGTPMLKMGDSPKISNIQVLTADRREYSRKPGFPDVSLPPPMNYPDPFIGQPDFVFNPEPEPFYGGGYEPTQDSQWMDGQPNPNWQPADIKTIGGESPPRGPHMMGPPSTRSPGRRSPSREQTRERSKSLRPRDTEREKSRRRERSKSRSRRHKSRSRSPSHRPHKKKKSRRHEDSD